MPRWSSDTSPPSQCDCPPPASTEWLPHTSFASLPPAAFRLFVLVVVGQELCWVLPVGRVYKVFANEITDSRLPHVLVPLGLSSFLAPVSLQLSPAFPARFGADVLSAQRQLPVPPRSPQSHLAPVVTRIPGGQTTRLLFTDNGCKISISLIHHQEKHFLLG